MDPIRLLFEQAPQTAEFSPDWHLSRQTLLWVNVVEAQAVNKGHLGSCKISEHGLSTLKHFKDSHIRKSWS